jgi:hypothetical protein
VLPIFAVREWYEEINLRSDVGGDISKKYQALHKQNVESDQAYDVAS